MAVRFWKRMKRRKAHSRDLNSVHVKRPCEMNSTSVKHAFASDAPVGLWETELVRPLP